MKRIIVSALIVFWTSTAWAHSPLEATVPANEAILAGVPDEVVLAFKGNIRLTRVTLTHAAHEVDLDLSAFDGFISDYSFPIQSMGAGTYQIDWRGLGDDGHPMNGTFRFTVEE
jgi:methionine-rich copper-binding protein CopC